jgi:putative transposase
MHRGYKFRLKPTAAQAGLLRRAAGCCRFVWNWFLSQKDAGYRASEGRGYNGDHDHAAQLQPMKLQFPWLKTDALSQALQQTLLDLDKAYTAFFEGRTSHPTKHRVEAGDSFRLPQGFERNGQAVFLPKIGWVRGIITRPILGTVCYATVSRDGDQWFISFCADVSAPADTKRERELQAEAAELEAERLAVAAGGVIGIDWGIAQPLTLSDGTVIELPRVTAAEQARLAVLQQRVSSKKPGSANRRKAVAKRTRFLHRIRRRRLDALHKVTTELAKNHRRIVIEDLQVDNLTASARGTVEAPGSNVAQKAGLNRSILDLSPALFRRLLTDKGEQFGSRLVVVPAHHTSQECSCCHHVSSLNRQTQARFSCVACGHAENADVNAAKVILARGIALIAPEAGPAFVTSFVPGYGSGSTAGTALRAA